MLISKNIIQSWGMVIARLLRYFIYSLIASLSTISFFMFCSSLPLVNHVSSFGNTSSLGMLPLSYMKWSWITCCNWGCKSESTFLVASLVNSLRWSCWCCHLWWTSSGNLTLRGCSCHNGFPLDLELEKNKMESPPIFFN